MQFNKSAKVGRFGPTLVPDGSQAPSLVVRSDGRIGIRFIHIKTKTGQKNEDILKGFVARIENIPGFGFTDDDIKGKPRRPLDPLLDPTNLKCFQEAVMWLRDQLQRA